MAPGASTTIHKKPMTTTAEEARKLVALAKAKNAINCVQHNLRYYPVLQQLRQMIAKGDLGDVLIVQGTYSQDWLLYDSDWNWRVSNPDGPPRPPPWPGARSSAL